MSVGRTYRVAPASAFLTIALWLLIALSPAAFAAEPFTVVDESGAPVAGAIVEARDAGGTRELGRTDAGGRITLPAEGSSGELVVRARGFETRTLAPGERPAIVSLSRTLPTIGVVRIATGTNESLHQLPVAASNFDRRTLALAPASTSDGVLRALPGFDRTRSNSQFTAYGQLRLSFSGAGTDRGSMFVDGVPAQDGFGGQIDYAAYPVAELQRVELLRDGGSSLYGSGGIGGVLAAQTFGPAGLANPPDGSLDLALGTYATQAAAVRLRGPVGPRVNASLSSDAGTITAFELPPGFQTPIDSDAVSTFRTTRLRAKYFGDGSSVEAGILDSYDQQQQGRPNYGFKRHMDQADARFERNAGDAQFAVSAFGRSWHVTNLADRAPAQPGVPLYTQQVPTSDLGAAAAWRRSGIDVEGDVRFVNGSNDQTGGNGALQSQASGHQTLAGLAVQGRWRGPRFETLAGARVDSIDSQGTTTSFGTAVPAVSKITSGYASAFSPRLAVRYDASPNTVLRASAAEGFRAPFLNELLRSYTISGVRYLGNPGLTPERSRSVDAGFDVAVSGLRYTVDFGQIVVSNAIGFLTLSPVLQQRSNFSQTQTDSVTAEVIRTLGPCSRLRASATSQYARVTSGLPANVGKRLAYVPQASASIGYDGRLGNEGLGLTLSYLGQTYADDLNLVPLGTALVAGARISAPLSGGASLTLGAENFANREYRSTSDRLGPPPTVTLRLRLPLGPAVPDAAPDCRIP